MVHASSVWKNQEPCRTGDRWRKRETTCSLPFAILQQCITVGSLPLAKNAMHSPSILYPTVVGRCTYRNTRLLILRTSRWMQCIFGERERSNCVHYFSWDDTAEFQLFEAHCVDKRAYLCRLLRRLEGDWIRFPAVSKARRCRQLAHERRVYTYAHTRRTEHAGVCVVECKIELTFVKLGSAYYGMCSARLIQIYILYI